MRMCQKTNEKHEANISGVDLEKDPFSIKGNQECVIYELLKLLEDEL